MNVLWHSVFWLVLSATVRITNPLWEELKNCNRPHWCAKRNEVRCSLVLRVTSRDHVPSPWEPIIRPLYVDLYFNKNVSCIILTITHQRSEVASASTKYTVPFVTLREVKLLRGLELQKAELQFSSSFSVTWMIQIPVVGEIVCLEALRYLPMKLTFLDARCRDPDIIIDFWKEVEDAVVYLDHLSLQGCHIQNMTFPRKLSIRTLKFSDCTFTSLTNSSFESLHNLQTLSLKGSGLKIIPQGIAELTELQHLDLSGNPLYNFNHFSSLLPLRKLEVVNFSDIPVRSFQTLKPLLSSSLRLRILDLANCDINTFDDEDLKLLSHQMYLHVLNLSKNRLQNIPFNWGFVSKSLKVLNLSSNVISSLYFYFHIDGELDIVDLSHNRLKYIGSIVRAGKVNMLNLAYNKINFLNISNIGSVRNVNLSHNTIYSVSKNVLITMESLELVDLGRNPFDCKHCDVVSLQEWLKKKNNVQIVSLNGSEDFFCAHPVHPRLRVLDATVKDHCNEIYGMHDPVFAKMSSVLLVVSMAALVIVLVYEYRFETSYFLHLFTLHSFRSNRKISQAYKYDAFVCYSNADQEWVVGEMVRRLEAMPYLYKICEHERDFFLGSFISNNVLHAMQKSQFILLVLSNNFFRSQWCSWELEMARHRQFEDGDSCLIIIELEPLSRSLIPFDLRCLLHSQCSLRGPEDPTLWEKLPGLLGTSIALQNTENE